MGWIYEKNEDNTSRYVLGTVGDRPLVCIGINTSTAVPNNLDPTLKSVVRISKANGFDSWIMLNVYPQRATNPNDMHNELDSIIHIQNMIHIEKIIKEYKPTIWAAWGTVLTKRPYLINCLQEIVDISKKYECQWVSAGQISKQGHPHHPLYLKNNEPIKGFDIDEYLSLSSIQKLKNKLK